MNQAQELKKQECRFWNDWWKHLKKVACKIYLRRNLKEKYTGFSLILFLVQENDFSIETPIITKDVNYYNIADSHKVPSIKLDSNRFSKFSSNSITPRVYTRL